jgi:5-methylcytosine-specific restriction endonuclease McrA
MTYAEQLLDERWITKREEIKRRDFGMCQNCMSVRNLNVHHKKYIKGLMAWEYPDWFLVTLCQRCHEKEHKHTEIPVLEELPALDKSFMRLKSNVKLLRALIQRQAENFLKKASGEKIH